MSNGYAIPDNEEMIKEPTEAIKLVNFKSELDRIIGVKGMIYDSLTQRDIQVANIIDQIMVEPLYRELLFNKGQEFYLCECLCKEFDRRNIIYSKYEILETIKKYI